MKKFLTLMSLLITVFSINFDCKATVITAISSGSWKTAANWDLGREPACGDTINIPLLVAINISKTINLNAAGPECAAVKLNVSGLLTFSNGAKLRLADGACVTVSLGGIVMPSLVGGGASENISIDAVKVWQASDGPLLGPASFGCSVILPAELVSFSVNKELESYSLLWTVNEEQNLAYYEVFVSDNGANWTSITKQSAFGTTSSEQNYNFRYMKEAVANQQLYFKLQSNDLNGKTSILALETIKMDLSTLLNENELIVYPNPTSQNNIINVIFQANSEDEVTVEILDLSGKLIQQKIETSVKGQNVILLETTDFIKGNYIVKLKTNEFCSNKKMMVI